VQTVTNVVDLDDQEFISTADWNLDDLHLVFILFKFAAVDKVALRINISLEWIWNLEKIHWVTLAILLVLAKQVQ